MTGSLDNEKIASPSGTFVTNVRPDSESLEQYKDFFTAIGYLAWQVALIEDELKQASANLTNDLELSEKQTANKNLGGLLPMYKMCFFAKFSDNKEFIDFFKKIERILIRANRYRIIAVHTNWGFCEGSSSEPVRLNKHSIKGVPCVTLDMMQKRAQFAHEAFCLLNDLRAVSESELNTAGPIAVGYDAEGVASSWERLKAMPDDIGLRKVK